MIVSKAPCGMQYAVRKAGGAVAFCALSIRVGTRDEGLYPAGIAHFVEHTLFKGTDRRGAASINNCLERLGGELNALTTKEEIVLHATVLQKDLPKALDLLLEIAFRASFPEEDIEVEKGVVLDEIASYEDSPSEDIYDKFEQKLFGSHPLSRLILGTQQSVQEISVQQLRSFRSRFFVPGRMALSVVSPMDEEQCRRLVLRRLSSISAIQEEPEMQAAVPAPLCAPFDVVLHKDNHQVNEVLGGFAPCVSEEKDRLATILLCNILGGPASNSILNATLREKHGWVYNVECFYTPYRDSGVVAIAFGCDRHNLRRCESAVRRAVRALQEKELSPAALKAAKRQLLGQNAIGLENGEAQCLSMGKSLLSWGCIPVDGELERKVEQISAAQLQHLCREILDPERLSRMVYD